MRTPTLFYRLLLGLALVSVNSACNKEDSFIIGQTPVTTTTTPVVIGTYALKSSTKGTYLTVSNNTVILSSLATTNTSVQWVLLKSGTAVLIRNNSTNTYLSTLGANLLSTNSTAVASQWIQQLYTTGVYRFINSGNINAMLNVETGTPAISVVSNTSLNANWILVPL
jgi:hypothetical protein